MSSPTSNGYDPVFYLHHAFVDYVYELFRRRQFRRCGVDPALDYPELPAGDPHNAEAPMTGFEWLSNRDGIKHDWMDNWYDYESTPSCPNCCEGCSFPAPIYCDRRRRVCVARSRRQFAFGPVSEQTRIQDIFAQAQLETREIETLEYQSPPRNRGHEYQAPPSDGRTLQTAIADAFETMQEQELAASAEGNRGSSENLPPTVELRETSQPNINPPHPDHHIGLTERQLPDILEQQLADRHPQSIQAMTNPMLDHRGPQPTDLRPTDLRPQPILGRRRQPFPDSRPSLVPMVDFRSSSMPSPRRPLRDPRGTSMGRHDRITDLRGGFMDRVSTARRPFLDPVRT